MAKAFTWDGPISNDSDNGFTLLKEGDYDYTVQEVEKSYSQKSEAPMAVVTLKVGDDKQSTTVKDYLVLNEKSEWKLSQFFRSIGLKKHGETYYMEWDKVPGASGRCKIKIDEYKKTITKDDGTEEEEIRQSNKINRYYDPVPQSIEWT